MARNSKKNNAYVSHGGRITIAALAQSLGLTKGTVSRALSGYPDISPNTKQRVREAARKLGYQPSASATAIKSGKTRSALFVMNSGWDEAHPAGVVNMGDGISRELLSAGCMLCVNSVRHDDDLEQVSKVLLAGKRVDGLIIPRPAQMDARVSIAQDSGLPFLTFGRPPRTNNPYIDVDVEACVSCSMAKLVAHGHHEIAFVGSCADQEDSDLWLTAFRCLLKKNGLAERLEHILCGASDMESVKSFATGLLTSNSPPTAFLCSRDLAAVAVISAAKECGLAVGRQVSVVGFGGDPLCEEVAPQLASFKVDFQQIGQEIAAQFLRCLEPGREPAPTTLYEAKYIRGSTVGQLSVQNSS